ncbi:peroxiredoxin [Altererythrobacter sp. CAU 1778]
MFRKIALTAALAALASAPLAAELPRGADAPGFTARGAKAGKPMSFNLKKALRNGPVVLYFFPKAYTQGCTLEANAFAEAMDDFRAAGATVVGMSNDDLPTLIRFSREECRDEFAVASASSALVKAYDVDLIREGKSTGLTNRVSYVIGQDGRIAFVHSDLDWRDHVRLTLARVRAMKAARR